MIRPLCCEHHITEFNALPNSRRHEASTWITVAKEDCAECKRLAELQPAIDTQRIEELEAEVEQLQRELHDEQIRCDEWEKMYNQAIAGTNLRQCKVCKAMIVDPPSAIRPQRPALQPPAPAWCSSPGRYA